MMGRENARLKEEPSAKGRKTTSSMLMQALSRQRMAGVLHSQDMCEAHLYHNANTSRYGEGGVKPPELRSDGVFSDASVKEDANMWLDGSEY